MTMLIKWKIPAIYTSPDIVLIEKENEKQQKILIIKEKLLNTYYQLYTIHSPPQNLKMGDVLVAKLVIENIEYQNEKKQRILHFVNLHLNPINDNDIDYIDIPELKICLHTTDLPKDAEILRHIQTEEGEWFIILK